MTYTALTAEGPRIALAMSEDLFHWQRLGLATFSPYEGIEFDGVDNKDASVFPVAIPDPSGKPAMAILHRPLFPGTRPEETACQKAQRIVDLQRESIWISYCPMAEEGCEPYHLCHFTLHNRLASPVAPWERLKIGGGTPPILTRHGWMVIYHGVHELAEPSTVAHKLCYSAGVLVLSEEHPRVIRYRSPEPVLTPELPAGTDRDGRQRRVSRPPSTGATISACPIDSTFITAWPTTGSESRVSTCPNSCRKAKSPTRLESRSHLPSRGRSQPAKRHGTPQS